MNTLAFFAYSYRLFGLAFWSCFLVLLFGLAFWSCFLVLLFGFAFWSCFSVLLFGFVAVLLKVVESIMGRTAVGSAIVSGGRGRRPRRPTNVGEKRGTAAPTICRKRGGATTRASKRKAGRPRLILSQDFSTQVEFKCCVTLPYVPRLCNGA